MPYDLFNSPIANRVRDAGMINMTPRPAPMVGGVAPGIGGAIQRPAAPTAIQAGLEAFRQQQPGPGGIAPIQPPQPAQPPAPEAAKPVAPPSDRGSVRRGRGSVRRGPSQPPATVPGTMPSPRTPPRPTPGGPVPGTPSRGSIRPGSFQSQPAGLDSAYKNFGG